MPPRHRVALGRASWCVCLVVAITSLGPGGVASASPRPKAIAKPALSTSSADLAATILANPRITRNGRDVDADLTDAEHGQPGTAGSPLSPALLQLLVVFGGSHSFTITALESGGTGHCDNRSKTTCPAHDAHYYGAAVDVASIDGYQTTGRDPGAIAAINVMKSLMPTSPGAYGSQSAFGQQGCPGAPTPALPAGIITFPDTCNHLHIQVPIGSTSIRGASSGGQKVAVARNADGRLELFGVSASGAPLHRWQLSGGGGWSPWATFDGNVTSIAAITNRDGRLEIFAVSSNGIPMHRWQQKPGADWSRWAAFDGGVNQLAIAQNAGGLLELFGVGAYGVVLHRSQLHGGGWSAWTAFGGPDTSVAAVTNADGRLELFATGANGAPMHRWQQKPGGVWSAWAAFDGNVTQLAAAWDAAAHLELFGVGADGVVVQRSRLANGVWSSWTKFDGKVTSIAAGTNADGRLELFGVASNGTPMHRWQQKPGADWTAWVPFDGLLQ